MTSCCISFQLPLGHVLSYITNINDNWPNSINYSGTEMYTEYIWSLHGCSVRTTVIWILDINLMERGGTKSVWEIGIYC